MLPPQWRAELLTLEVEITYLRDRYRQADLNSNKLLLVEEIIQHIHAASQGLETLEASSSSSEPQPQIVVILMNEGERNASF